MNKIKEETQNYLTQLQEAIGKINQGEIVSFAQDIINTYKNDGTIYIFGNGGSGANASHFCGDILKGLSCQLHRKFKSICLNDNSPAMMAIANDLSYEDIFLESLKVFLKPNDLVIGISGSGNSPNIVKPLIYANKVGALTIALCGFSGGKIKEIASKSVHVNINNMEICEDLHLAITHCVKNAIIAVMTEEDKPQKEQL